jgi:diguanylate cyclase (GGDEF)-like protein
LNRLEKPTADDLNLSGSNTLARLKLARLLDPPVLFTLIAIVFLTTIWIPTLHFIDEEKTRAEISAARLASDTADTYEAQVLSALRDIERTLDLVRYDLEKSDAKTTLKSLRARGLLLPEILFSIGITNTSGYLIAGELAGHVNNNLSGYEFFQLAMGDDNLVISPPQPDSESNELWLYFSRRIEAPNGDITGLVVISVPASFFVSAYQPETLGSKSVLGLVGTDGIFRVRQTGEVISGGDRIEYPSQLTDEDMTGSREKLESNSWDEVERYTVTRKLFGYPLATVVGIARKDGLAPASQLSETYLARAGGASAALIGVIALLGYLSWRLQRESVRAMRERLENAAYVEYLANYDTLTNLPNRGNFVRLLSQCFDRARRYDKHTALLYLDLDGFKDINDSLGYEFGDELLRLVGQRIKATVRESDIVARLGGDEFMVLLPEITSDMNVAPVARKILSAITEVFDVEGQELRITASIGISIFPVDGVDEQKLLKNADIAMYHAKKQGKNNFQFFSEKLNIELQERMALESRLRMAIEHDEFQLYYQPKLGLECNRITGTEALLRWHSPELGTIPPEKFIPLAEETGLIDTIGLWVLRTACRQCVTWREDGLPSLHLAVNLSPRQFNDPALYDNITEILRETGMDPFLLELEITESMLIGDLQWTLHILGKLKALGIRIAIDDFGTGYSSLSALKKLPIDSIKIDRSFIQDLTDSDADKSLVEAIIAMAKNLGLWVIAEGVETAGQVEFLRTRGCDEIQGFFISKPVPAEKIGLLSEMGSLSGSGHKSIIREN